MATTPPKPSHGERLLGHVDETDIPAESTPFKSAFESASPDGKDYGINSDQPSRRFSYFVKKDKDVFFARLVPAVKGYEPRIVDYHNNMGTFPLGDKLLKVIPYCNRIDCRSCLEAAEQHRLYPAGSPRRGSDFHIYDKKRRVEAYIVAFEMVHDERTGGYRMAKPSPMLLGLECDTRSLRSDTYSEMINLGVTFQKKGVDLSDPVQGGLFRFERVKSGGGGYGGAAYKVSVVEESVGKVPLPEKWLEELKKIDTLDDLYLQLSNDDIDLVIRAEKRYLKGKALHEQGKASLEEYQKFFEETLLQLTKSSSSRLVEYVNMMLKNAKVEKKKIGFYEPETKQNGGSSERRPQQPQRGASPSGGEARRGRDPVRAPAVARSADAPERTQATSAGTGGAGAATRPAPSSEGKRAWYDDLPTRSQTSKEPAAAASPKTETAPTSEEKPAAAAPVPTPSQSNPGPAVAVDGPSQAALETTPPANPAAEATGAAPAEASPWKGKVRRGISDRAPEAPSAASGNEKQGKSPSEGGGSVPPEEPIGHVTPTGAPEAPSAAAPEPPVLKTATFHAIEPAAAEKVERSEAATPAAPGPGESAEADASTGEPKRNLGNKALRERWMKPQKTGTDS